MRRYTSSSLGGPLPRRPAGFRCARDEESVVSRRTGAGRRGGKAARRLTRCPREPSVEGSALAAASADGLRAGGGPLPSSSSSLSRSARSLASRSRRSHVCDRRATSRQSSAHSKGGRASRGGDGRAAGPRLRARVRPTLPRAPRARPRRPSARPRPTRRRAQARPTASCAGAGSPGGPRLSCRRGRKVAGGQQGFRQGAQE